MPTSDIKRRPAWLRKKLSLKDAAPIKRSLRGKKLHTVCESARCPNIGECFSRRTATMMILGNECTRACGFCAVAPGRPAPPDPDEPHNTAVMVKELGLKHAVITSVTRDDLPDGGAEQFAKTLREIRRLNPGVTVELLVPDFGGNRDALDIVLNERPDILNHNIETVPSLYPTVRPQADYRRSLAVLEQAAAFTITAKSGIMVGFGETGQELEKVFKDLKQAGVEMLTIGQYLPPSRKHLQPVEYLSEEHFRRTGATARRTGIKDVFAGPYVRSSYLADVRAGKMGLI